MKSYSTATTDNIITVYPKQGKTITLSECMEALVFYMKQAIHNKAKEEEQSK